MTVAQDRLHSAVQSLDFATMVMKRNKTFTPQARDTIVKSMLETRLMIKGEMLRVFVQSNLKRQSKRKYRYLPRDFVRRAKRVGLIKPKKGGEKTLKRNNVKGKKSG
jgi:hypothetical protein